MADSIPLHIRITHQPKFITQHSMSNHNILLYGQASDAHDLLNSVDPASLDASDLTAALINCFNRIEIMEKQIQELGQRLRGEVQP